MVSSVFSISFKGVPVLGRSDPSGAILPLDCFIGGAENRLVRLACEDALRPQPRYHPLVFTGPSGSGKSLIVRGLATRWNAARSTLPMVATTLDHPPSGNLSGNSSDNLSSKSSGGGPSTPAISPTPFGAADALPALTLAAADFARHLAEAYETDSLDDFRRQLSNRSRVVIEDLHHLIGKEEAQHELARLIDRQHADHGMLLTTLPQLPAELHGMTPALVSRLSAGLTVPIALPGLAARAEILRRLAAAHHIALDEPSVALLAGGSSANSDRDELNDLDDLDDLENLDDRESAPDSFPWEANCLADPADASTSGGARGPTNALNGQDAIPFATPVQLQHAILQLKGMAEQQNQKIDVQLTRNLLSAHNPQPQPTVRKIVQAVANHFQVKVNALRGPSRRQTLSQCRGVAMYLARQTTNLSLEEIGRYFGNRDHTTVLHACRATSSRLASEPTLQAAFNELQSKLFARE